MKKIGSLSLIFLLYFTACVPSENRQLTEIKLNIQNAETQKLYDFQDRQIRDSIYPYFHHRDPSLRFRAAMAFASFKDSNSIDSLAQLLQDPVAKIKESAAFALGQIGDTLAEPFLISAFSNQDSLDINNATQAAILEAIGKCGTIKSLKALSNVSTYRPEDNFLLLGQTKGLYRFALRKMTTLEGTNKMVEYLTDDNIPEDTRLIAANYLFRAEGIDVSENKFQLSRVFSQHKDPRIRMVLARPLAKTADPEILNILLGQLSADADYRVKCNILRELGNFEYIDVVERILSLLNDNNHHLSNAAAQYLIDKGNPSDAMIYTNYARDSIHWQAKAKVYQSIMRHLPLYYSNTRAKIKNEIIHVFTDSKNPYEKSALVRAVTEDLNSYVWIRDQVMLDSSMVVRMSGLQQLGNILSHDQFDRIFSGRKTYTQTQILKIITEAIETGDAGLIALGTEIIQNEKSGLKPLIKDKTFLEAAKQKLKLPQDIEAYQSIQAALNFLNNEKTPESLPTNTDHRIDWSIINELSDSSRAYIFTSKGKITLKFNYQQAPGSVANFIKLAEEDFFNNKVFHRVIPNFVIQGGCPRGDGFGSLDYSIRSELASGSYNSEGKVGMASAGNHTECTQWFITHSPTPHLDGNYTIFAEVVSGIEVVHEIEIGDVIEDVRILKL